MKLDILANEIKSGTKKLNEVIGTLSKDKQDDLLHIMRKGTMKSQPFLDTGNEFFKSGVMDEAGHMFMKAVGHKYYKKEGSGKTAKYYYTKAEYEQATGKKEVGVEKEKGKILSEHEKDVMRRIVESDTAASEIKKKAQGYLDQSKKLEEESKKTFKDGEKKGEISEFKGDWDDDKALQEYAKKNKGKEFTIDNKTYVIGSTVLVKDEPRDWEGTVIAAGKGTGILVYDPEEKEIVDSYAKDVIPEKEVKEYEKEMERYEKEEAKRQRP